MRFNPALDALEPYRAGRSLHEIMDRYQLRELAQLPANEVAWGPFPKGHDALHAEIDPLFEAVREDTSPVRKTCQTDAFVEAVTRPNDDGALPDALKKDAALDAGSLSPES